MGNSYGKVENWNFSKFQPLNRQQLWKVHHSPFLKVPAVKKAHGMESEESQVHKVPAVKWAVAMERTEISNSQSASR